MATRHESRLVGLALDILRDVAHPHFRGSAQTKGAQLALRVLQPYANRDNLRTFWSIAGQEAGGNRAMRLAKVLTLIESVALRRMAGL